MRAFPSLLLSGLLVSCGVPPAMVNNSMTLAELGALECKSTIESLVKEKTGQTITLRDAETSPQCPVAKQQTYRQSLSSSLGSAFETTTIACQGSHHTGAGYLADYPRYDGQKGLLDSPEGQRVPLCFGLILPEDAKVISTGAKGSDVKVSFTTGGDFATLADGYHRMLNGGREQVLAIDPLKHGIAGSLGGIPYRLRFEQEQRRIDVVWSPPLAPVAAATP